MNPSDLEIESFHKTGISGTDAPAIVGLSPWKSAADVWISKKRPDLVTRPEGKKKERLDIGSMLEKAIADEYARRLGVTIFKPTVVRHPQHDWCIGSPDYFIKGQPRGLEVKTEDGWNKEQWGPQGTDDIPPWYMMQVTHYMNLTDMKEWDVIVLIGLGELRTYRIHADKELQTMLWNAEKDFYSRFIVGNERPEFDDGEMIREYIKKRWPKDNGKVVEITPYDGEIKRAMIDVIAAHKARAAAIKEFNRQKQLMQSLMGPVTQFVWPEEEKWVKWKKTKDGKKVNWYEIAQQAMTKSSLTPEQKAELISKYTTPTQGARRFTVSGDDEDEEEESSKHGK